MDISTSVNAELQINFELMTLQLITTGKPFQIITYKDSSTNTVGEGKETFVHVVIQSLKHDINSLKNQLKDKQKTIDGLFNLNSCQCSCNSVNGNHQEQKLAENAKRLPAFTNDSIKADILTNNNEEALTENNHILENNNKSNLNRRDKLLKKDNTDKEKRVSNIRPDCGVSPETSSPKLNIEIIGDLMINGITLVELSRKCKHKLRIKLYGGEMSEDLVNNIRPSLRRKPDVVAIHIGTNDITNDNCSIIQINLNKIRDLVIELSPSTKIVVSLRHGKINTNVKINRRNEINSSAKKKNSI